MKERSYLIAITHTNPYLSLWQEFPSLWRPLHSTMSQQHEMSSHYTPSHQPRHATEYTAPREEYPWYQEQNQLEEGRKGGRGERKRVINRRKQRIQDVKKGSHKIILPLPCSLSFSLTDHGGSTGQSSSCTMIEVIHSNSAHER